MSTQFLKVNGGTIAYDSTGAGPLVVCLPGIGDVRQQFRFLAAQLVEAGYRVVTMDIRGQGESSVEWQDYSVAGVGSDIVALVRHLDAGPAAVVGNSFSAGAAVWAAVEAPAWVRALVLIGPAVHGDLSWPMRTMVSAMFARPWGAATWAKYYATLYPARKPADWNDYIARLKDNLSQPGRLAAMKRITFASKAAAAERLDRVNVPALVVMGTKDPDFKDPTAEAQWVAGQVKGTCEIVEGAGHYPHTEMPEVTGPRILAFLQTLEQEPSRAAPAR